MCLATRAGRAAVLGSSTTSTQGSVAWFGFHSLNCRDHAAHGPQTRSHFAILEKLSISLCVCLADDDCRRVRKRSRCSARQAVSSIMVTSCGAPSSHSGHNPASEDREAHLLQPDQLSMQEYWGTNLRENSELRYYRNETSGMGNFGWFELPRKLPGEP
jgi:hypothetical protein